MVDSWEEVKGAGAGVDRGEESSHLRRRTQSFPVHGDTCNIYPTLRRVLLYPSVLYTEGGDGWSDGVGWSVDPREEKKLKLGV
jgi:hypothetical protein